VSKNIIDLTGKRFGWLTVVAITEERIHGSVVWLCKCNCGNETKGLSTSLIGGGKKSCGCLSGIKNRIGQRFGQLIVIALAKERYHEGAVWICKCDCGNEKMIPVTALVSGHTKSCGCLHKKQVSKKPYEALYKILEFAAKKRNLDIISFDEFLWYTNIKHCFYCGANIRWVKCNTGKNGRHYNLDRIDNSLGYILKNIVVCCPKCNQMKHTLTQKEFLKKCKQVAEYQESKEGDLNE